MGLRCGVSPQKKDASSSPISTKEIVATTPLRAPSLAKHSATVSTGPPHFKTPPSSSGLARPANSTPSKSTSPRKNCRPSPSRGRSRSGGYTFWDLSLARSGATATSTSPSTNLPSGLRLSLSAQSRQDLQSSSSRGWCVALASPTASSPTMGLSSLAASSNPTAPASGPKSATPLSLTREATARLSGPTLRYSRASRPETSTNSRPMARTGSTSSPPCYGQSAPREQSPLARHHSSSSTGRKQFSPL